MIAMSHIRQHDIIKIGTVGVVCVTQIEHGMNSHTTLDVVDINGRMFHLTVKSDLMVDLNHADVCEIPL